VPAAKFRAVIFDIGRVLVRVDVARAMSGLGQGMGLAPEELWSAIGKDPHWPDWQEGRMTARDWHLHLAKRLGGSLTFEQFTEVWNRALDSNPIQDDDFLEKLSKRYRLALLSNTDPIHVAHMEGTYDFMRHFPNRLYSCAVGASKPNPLIFREALRACKVNAEEAVYIDDVPGYVEAARRLGMTGIVFRSPEQLQADLKMTGVEVD
jgi:glucose-1-phosphatase